MAAVHTYIYTHVHCLANSCAPNKSTAIRSKQGQTQVSKLGSTQGQCTDKRVKKASDKAIQTANVETGYQRRRLRNAKDMKQRKVHKYNSKFTECRPK